LANATSLNDAPAPFTDYQYRVVAVNAVGEATSTVATLAQAPAAPTGLTAAASAPAATPAKWSVNLKWTDAATNETGYVVQRATGTIAKTGAVTWGAFASKPAATSVLAPNLTTFPDGPTGVAANTLYQYQVYALNGALVGSAASAIVATATTLAPPTQVQAQGKATTSTIGIAWQNTTSALATGYEVQTCLGAAAACNSPTATWKPALGIPVVGAGTTKLVVSGLTQKTQYSFHIRAVNNLLPLTAGSPSLTSTWTAPFSAKTL
jgi:fibronectin type 3 domain-containing protein